MPFVCQGPIKHLRMCFDDGDIRISASGRDQNAHAIQTHGPSQAVGRHDAVPDVCVPSSQPSISRTPATRTSTQHVSVSTPSATTVPNSSTYSMTCCAVAHVFVPTDSGCP